MKEKIKKKKKINMSRNNKMLLIFGLIIIIAYSFYQYALYKEYKEVYDLVKNITTTDIEVKLVDGEKNLQYDLLEAYIDEEKYSYEVSHDIVTIFNLDEEENDYIVIYKMLPIETYVGANNVDLNPLIGLDDNDIESLLSDLGIDNEVDEYKVLTERGMRKLSYFSLPGSFKEEIYIGNSIIASEEKYFANITGDLSGALIQNDTEYRLSLYTETLQYDILFSDIILSDILTFMSNLKFNE